MEHAQHIIESTYSRRNIRDVVRMDIDDDHEIITQIEEAINDYRLQNYHESKYQRIRKLNMANEIAIELLIAVLPIETISPIQAVATQLGEKLGYANLLDGIKTAAEILAVCEKTGLYTIFHSSNHENETGTLGIRANFKLGDVTRAFIDRTKYLPPMVCKPVKWADNSTGGYLQGSGSAILGYLNHHNHKQSLDVLNILQDIEWSLDDIMVNYDEQPTKPFISDEQAAQFQQMHDQSTEVYQSLMDMGNKFYFVWKFDKRGRMYSQGYHCNLQSTEYKKSILNFAKQEVIS